MNNRCCMALFAGLLASLAAQADPFDLSGYRLLDLGHAYGADTLYWPGRPVPRFELEQLAYGETPAGTSTQRIDSARPSTAARTSTHLIHFAREGMTTDQLPLTQLIAPAVRIDVREQATRDHSYRLQPEDIRRFEQKWGVIRPGTIVLLQTGWSQYWPDRKAYFGSESAEDASGLEFPSYGEEAARILVKDRGVALLGVDTASIDFGRSRDFVVHRIAAAANVGGLENLTNLDQVPETGFHVIALPMKIRGGSGGPVRVVALVPR